MEEIHLLSFFFFGSCYFGPLYSATAIVGCLALRTAIQRPRVRVLVRQASEIIQNKFFYNI